MTHFRSRCALALAFGLASVAGDGAARAERPAGDSTPPSVTAVGSAADVEFFEAAVRPLLAARCHECHGAKTHKGNLRLDSRAAALAGGDTGPAIVPGEPDKSLLVDAVRYGETYQMPPKSQLPAEEIATLVEWVRRGAPWGAETASSGTAASGTFDLAARARGHWSFQPIAGGPPPAVADEAWIRTPLDRYTLARLEAAGLAPAEAVDKRALLRRVTYDLTGLPPTPDELAAFLADASRGAYGAVVDRLLASPRYGERWARHWLDLVRYAETHGHEFDFDVPNAYRYRDYVIRALNADLPFDRFVIEHVAGDLVEPPRRRPVEGSNESILGTGWYFFGEALHSPVDVRADEADRIDNQIDVFSKTFLGLTVSCARCHDHKFDAISTRDYYALAGYLQSSRYQQACIDPPEARGAALAELDRLHAERQRACGAAAGCGAAPHNRTAAEPAGCAAAIDTTPAPLVDFSVAEFAFGDFGAWRASGDAFGRAPARPFTWTARGAGPLPARLLTRGAAHSGLLSPKLQGTLRSPTFEISAPALWYRVYGDGGKMRLIVDGLQLIREPIYGPLEFAPAGHEPHWHRQDVSKWVGHRAYIEIIDDGDGYLALEEVCFSEGPAPGSGHQAVPAVLAAGAWLDVPSALVARCQQRLAANIGGALAPLDAGIARVESALSRPSMALAIADGTAENERVFIRGNPKTLGEEVPRRFLEALGGADHAPPAAGSGRLELARQLVDPANPLVSRVIVNRLWHHHFGAGIVRSPDDFGEMGQRPTHPELLDYLAGELVRHGWSLKHLHRQIVLSNTYQMSSRPVAAADAADPDNRLWHRRVVRRLEAEAIRDAMLLVSGRLDARMYGPGVMPHLTEFMSGRGRPQHSGPLDGDGRRSIYLAVRRNFLSPLFLAFDYPTPFTTIGRRGTSNVPAQSLAMMNNPFVIEQARLWADRVLAGSGASPADQIRAMYLAAFSRPPEEAELGQAIEFVAAAQATMPPREAWTHFAHVLFNAKEFVFIP